jgi:DNA polymerase-3 subunit gamma/tau
MEYIVSARKYRPMSFDTVVGQSALTTTLKNAVKSGKLAHAYLFCGPRGVGKTTCARIFAKAINCQNPTADGEACGECESCQSFNEQRSLNIFELDAASNNSVEHIKTLMEQTRIPPQVGKYKVFIIDEVHMLSTQAFNAFLKTLEEPPAHVVFILATTEKQKILPTILSRCQIYDFERMTVQNTIDHLKSVAQKEGIQYEEEALAVIAEKADGGMRDALSIFDQAASFCQGNITYQKVIEDLNVLDAENYFRFVDLSLENKVAEVMVLLNGIIDKGFDTGLLVQGLARHVRNVLMAKDPQTLPLLEVSEQQRQRYVEQARRAPVRMLFQALKLMNQCDINYRQSANKRLLVELTLIEIAQLTQPDDAAAGAGRQPRRLKTLFRKLTASLPRQRREQPSTQPEVKSAPQVAAAATNAPSSSPSGRLGGVSLNSPQEENSSSPSGTLGGVSPEGDNSSSPSGRLGGVSPSGRIGGVSPLRLSSITSSWGNLRRQAQPRKMQLLPGTPGVDDKQKKQEQESFTQDELELQWMAMCNRMPQRLQGLAARMKNMNPVIVEAPALEVVVPNEMIKAEVETIKGNILSTLRLYLHNSAITLDLRVARQEEHQKILTRREQYDLMCSSNPTVAKLAEVFNLVLA